MPTRIDTSVPLAAMALLAGLLVWPGTATAQEGGDETSESEEGESASSEESSSDGSSTGENGPTPTVALLPLEGATDDVSSIVPERIGEMLRKRLQTSGDIELLKPFARMVRGGSDADTDPVTQARKQYRSGLGLANAGEFEKAADPLSSSVETLRANIENLQKFSVYTDALLKLAWSYWNIDHNYDARKSIREYAHLRPNADLDSDKYPTKLLEIYKKEAKKVREGGPGELVIETDPKGATVWIDGEKEGTSPITLSDVGYGYHYLVVEGPEGRRRSKRLQVRGKGNKQTFSVSLEDDEKKDEEAGDEKPELPAFYRQLRKEVGDGVFDDSGLEAYVKEFADETGASHVVWVLMIQRESTYEAAPFVYRVEDGRLVAADRVEFSIQLTGMRANVRDLKKTVLAHVESMPEADAVASVDLPPDRETSEEADQEKRADADETEQEKETSSEEGTSTDGDKRASESESVEPPPTPEEESDDDSPKGPTPWTYVGIGGATVAVGGLVVGGVILLDGSGGAPTSFSATVTW